MKRTQTKIYINIKRLLILWKPFGLQHYCQDDNNDGEDCAENSDDELQMTQVDESQKYICPITKVWFFFIFYCNKHNNLKSWICIYIKFFHKYIEKVSVVACTCQPATRCLNFQTVWIRINRTYIKSGGYLADKDFCSSNGSLKCS